MTYAEIVLPHFTFQALLVLLALINALDPTVLAHKKQIAAVQIAQFALKLPHVLHVIKILTFSSLDVRITAKKIKIIVQNALMILHAKLVQMVGLKLQIL